ncbi:hypothetical protein HanXRQr2_Chr01g0007461 [Helianthus annuus]|uniref:Uncharacterized protein n=1 Tax=Helianthus annuus TaxID=4232 RepID=A0A9K3JTK2_HELAN|nr:hypothetical protein HanXRQr2_Chr01g0007461 [Helianthus annuus]KAJ0815591.1 hypothetical protein HanLR1_Chr00c0710g0768831 [Helianthus annuus]
MRASKRNRNCDDQWWFSTMILDSSTAVILKVRVFNKLPEVQKFLNASACSWYQQVIGTCWYSFSVDWAEIGISKDQPYLSKNRFD